MKMRALCLCLCLCLALAGCTPGEQVLPNNVTTAMETAFNRSDVAACAALVGTAHFCRFAPMCRRLSHHSRCSLQFSRC